MTDHDFKHEIKTYPLSPVQERVLAETLLSEDDSVYNMVSVMRIRDRWDDNCFMQAFRLLGVRFPVLRTVVFTENGVNGQYVNKNGIIPCSVVSADSIEEFVSEETSYKFDPYSGGLFRGRLVHGKDCDRLIENAHHIILDGFSYYLVNKALIRYHDLLRSGTSYEEVAAQAEKEAEADLSYEKYVRTLADKNKAVAKEYWSGLMSGYEGGEIKPHSTVEGGKTGRAGCAFRMPSDLYERIKAFCAENLMTVSILSKAVWAILLKKYAYTEDIVFGDAVSGRSRGAKELKNAVGLFFNVLPVRIDLKKGKKTLDLCSELRTQQVKGSAYGYLPPEETLSAADVGSVGTFFNFMPQDAYYYSEDDLFRMEKIINYSGYDLEWYINCDREFTFELNYNTALYSKEDISDLADRIFSVFRFILDHPDCSVDDVDALSEKDKKLLSAYNRTEKKYDKNETVVDRFEKQAKKTPERTAVSYYGRTLSYRELNEKASSIAAFLQEKGVKKGDCVALYLRRSPEMIAAIFGVLKAGAVYLPLDESYPEERLSFVLSDSGAVCILTDGLKIKTDLPSFDVKGVPAESEHKVRIGGDDRAYYIYTSGTTGVPKGVITLHKGLSNLLLSYEKIYDLTEKDVVLQVASYTFDQSVWDIFGVLCVGGKLALISYDDVRDPDKIALRCEEEKVTIASFTPAMIAELDPDKFTSLRILDSSGEAASASVLKRWVGKKRVINTYGPTEYTVNSCSYEYKGLESENVPIGGPNINTRFFVLDKGGALCGRGMCGELCIAGEGLAEGYLNRPELTEQKFTPAFDGKGKMYRTGDLAFWNKEGNIVFVDRIDQQVKIRGFRIELGEVENAIRNLPGIKDCYVRVVKRDDVKAIVAYLVGEDVDVRKKLSERLPGYMVPQYYVTLDRIPRSISGKVDKKALPGIAVSEQERTLPSTPKEKILAVCWKEVLGEKAYMEDDFIESGGDSIKAIRLSAKLFAAGIALSVKQIMQEKTFAKMAEVSTVASSESRKKQDDISERDIAYAEHKFGKSSIEKIYRLTPLQEGMLFRALYDGDAAEYKTQIVIEMPNLDLNVFSVALNLAALRYEVTRTAFLYTERGGLQVILKDRKPKISSASGNVDEIAARDRALPFDIENDSLCRIIGVRDGDKNYLIQSSHHLIVDGWSSVILLSKLREYYMRLFAGEKYEDILSEIEKEKKEKSTFKDFVDTILSKDATEAAAHYKKLIGGFDGGTEYPSAGEKTPLDVAVERYVDFPDLSDIAKKVRATEAVLYQVAWGIVLGATDLSGDAMFGNVLSGRTERLEGVEEIVGMCINTVPVRVRYDEETTLADVIADVEKQSEDNTQYGFLPLSTVAKNIGTITVFESSNERTSAIVKSVFDQTEYDLELQTTEEDSRCILRYNNQRYKKEEIDRLARMMTSVFNTMKKDVSVLVKDIPLLTEKEKEEYRIIKLRNPNKEKVSAPIPLKTEKEKLVASCMQELLSVKVDSANADFFDLGGDSISAIRLSAKLRSAGYKATVRQIMTLKTIEKIASDMTKETLQSVLTSGKVGYGVTSADYTYAVDQFGENMIESINRITPLQEGILFYALSEEGPAYNTQTVIPVPPLDIGILKGTLRLLSRKYEVLRSNFIWTETGGLQVVLKDRFPETRVASGSVKEIAEQDLFRGFDLKDDSLFRVTYVKDGEQNYLIKSIHHLLADGWSDAIITEEMKKIYYGILSGDREEEEPAPAFATYIEYLYRKDKTKAKEYYAEVMRGFTGSTDFPSRKKKDSSCLAQEKTFTLSGIKQKADALSVRPSDIAQTVWGLFLAKSNVREDVVFGNVISGRNDDFPNMERMVGMFINTVPVRVRTEGSTLKEVLSSVACQSQNNLEYGFLPLSETGVIPRSVVIYDNNEKDESAYSIVDQTGYDMELECFGEDCILRYNPECYLTGDIDYAVQALLTLYNVMTESPDTLVSEVRIFSAELEKALLASKKKRAVSKVVLLQKPLTTDKEKTVASCIESLLTVKVDNANADFFDLGGDSISAIRLSAKLRSAGYKATVKQIMTLKTVGGIASAMTEESEQKGYSVSKIGIGVKPSDYEYATEVFGEKNVESVSRMTPLQEGMLFYALTEDGPAYNTQTVVPVAKTEAGIIKKALDILANKYEVLRSNFVWTETGGLQVVLKNRSPELNVASGDVKSIAERDLFRGFDLKKDSLFRVTYVEGEQNYLIRNIHHLIADGWSDSILTDELKKIRDALLSGAPIEEEKAPPFASYVEYLYRKDKDEAKNHFAELMIGFSGATGLPHISDAQTSGYAEEKTVTLSDLSKKAESLSVLPSDLIQTAWGILVAQANGVEDAVFGNVLSGRSGYFPGIEKMVGMFINTVPVRVMTNEKTFGEALAAVKKQSEENAEYGFLSLSETGVLPDTVVVFDNFGGKKEKDCFIVDQTGYDMELEYSDGECVLRYDPKKYPAEYVARISDGLLSIIDAIAERPDEPVSSLRLFADVAPARESTPKVQKEEKKKVPLKTEKEIMLASCVKEVLSVEPENASDDFFVLGGDSISAIRLSAKLRKEGYFLSVRDVMAAKTIAEMARRAVLWSGEDAPACGTVPLTPVMTDFFARNYPDPDGYVQEVLLQSEVGFGRVREALQAVYEHHDMLRATFSGGKLVVPELSESAPLLYEETETDDAIKTCAEIKNKVKMSGPMFAAALIRQKGVEYLYLCAHHLVVDGVSWRVIWEDFSLGCAGEKLPIKTSSYLSWAKKCAAGVKMSEKEEDFWRLTENRIAPVFTEKGNAPFSIEFGLLKEETRRIAENAARIFGTRRDVAMLSALARAINRTLGKEETAVLMESHGRQPLFDGDITRTVGWFTSYYPVIFSGKGSEEECVIENKERLLSVPEGGVRYQFTERKNPPEIIFNYMGEYNLGNSPIKLCSLPVPEDNPEREALDVEGEINGGILSFSLRFNGPSKEVGEKLKESFRQELLRICALCADEKEKIYSPADLGYPGMDKDDFVEAMKSGPVRIAPLTPTQQGMLFHSEDDKEEYLEQSAIRLPFTPDVKKAEALLSALANKYAVFRTVYVRCKSGNVYQCVLGSANIKLNIADDLSAVRKRRVKEGVSPFDGVPLRLDLIGDVLLITSHHILLDAWSEGLFIDEFEKLYLEDRVPEEREEVSFCEYASEYPYSIAASDYAYWTSLVKGATSSLVPGHGVGVRGENRRTIKEISASEKVLSFARKNGVTENSVFEAAAARFIQILCGKTDVIFGKVVSGRNEKTSNAVGLYISTVPVRVQAESAQDVLSEIEKQARDSSRYEVCPLNEIFKRAGLQDPIGMLFVYDSIESKAKTKPLFVRDSTNYGITLAVSKEDKFIADISYNDGEYLPEEIDAFLSLYAECVEEIVEGKEPVYQPLSGKKVSYPSTLTEIWNNHPDFTLFADKEYSAEEISRRAEILSGYLRERYEKGIIGVRLERGVDMIVALLGIVLSGSAYMPIGVDYPEERIKYMVENAGARTVLDQKFMSSFKYDGPRFVADVKGEDICYVIYTSGSTGRPKGAKISHKAIANRLCWMEKRYPLLGGAILQKTPYTFDVSVWDIFRPLLFGGRLVLTPPGLHADPKTIAELVKKYSVTQAHFVPSVYDIYLEYCQENEVAPIKDLFLSGEKLGKKTVEKHNAVFGKNSALHNLYGPTECAVDVTYYDLNGKETDVPIGKPVDNTEIAVVSRGKVVPPYVEGEIVVGGVNVGSGYIGKNQGGFVDGKYYTGDIGWTDKNGEVHFVGRKDRQIKWNGMRIEPGEIEWQIGRIDGVKDAAVAVVGKTPALCAFIVAEDKEKTDGEIKRRLPEYLMPTRRIYVDKIPLSENGKRDLAALSQVAEESHPMPQAAKAILGVVEEVVGGKIGFDTPFEQAGIGSLERIRLSVKLAPFGFAFADLVRADSVRELYLRDHNEYFMKFAGGNDKAVLCIPYAGGTARIYKDLSPAGYDVYAAVGCTFDEKDWTSVVKEAKRIKAEYKKVVLYAHCLGGMTALKLAEEVGFDLVIFGAHVPDAVSSFFGRPIDSWKHTSDKNILAALAKGGLKGGETDFAPLFRKDASRAARIEAEKPIISAPAVLLLAEDDPFASKQKAEKRWKKFLRGEIIIKTLAGKDHYFISDKDFGDILLTTMEDDNG